MKVIDTSASLKCVAGALMLTTVDINFVFLLSTVYPVVENKMCLNPLTAYIRVFIFDQHIKYHLLNMLKIICDINQQYLNS